MAPLLRRAEGLLHGPASLGGMSDEELLPMLAKWAQIAYTNADRRKLFKFLFANGMDFPYLSNSRVRRP